MFRSTGNLGNVLVMAKYYAEVIGSDRWWLIDWLIRLLLLLLLLTYCAIIVYLPCIEFADIFYRTRQLCWVRKIFPKIFPRFVCMVIILVVRIVLRQWFF